MFLRMPRFSFSPFLHSTRKVVANEQKLDTTNACFPFLHNQHSARLLFTTEHRLVIGRMACGCDGCREGGEYGVVGSNRWIVVDNLFIVRFCFVVLALVLALVKTK